MKILGFDLGDGESAAALLDSDSAVEPRMLPLCGQVSLLSAVGTKEGAVIIGEQASVLGGVKDACVRFKSRYLTDEQAAASVRLFAQGVMNEIRRSEPGVMAEVTRTVVGCPAGWGEVRRQRYAALIESAGFPNVSVVPEPRAAFLYARHARGLRVDAGLLRSSALVIDIGSSTTDFAYIVDGRQQNLTLFGDPNLGGGVMDEMILEQAFERSADGEAARDVCRRSPAWRSYLLLQARRLKERYYADEIRWRQQGLRMQVSVYYDEPLTLEMQLDEQTALETVTRPCAALGGIGFITCLTDALAAAKKVSADCPPQAVVVTGGASRMAFFREAVNEAFPQSVCVLCPEPECSIARGLAYCGLVDEQLKVFRREVASLSHGERLRRAVDVSVHGLYAPLAEMIYEQTEEVVLEGIRLWRRGGIETLEGLEQVIAREMKAALSGERMQRRLEKPLHLWTRQLLQTIEGELSALCMRCGVPPERMSLQEARVDAGVDHVPLSLMDAIGVDLLSGVLGVALVAVSASVLGGSGTALAAGGPAGLAVGAGVGIVLAMIGRAGMERALRRTKLPRLVRCMVTDSAVKSGLARQKEEIVSGIVRALSDPSGGFSARLCESLASTLGMQLERMAEEAEMSVCA